MNSFKWIVIASCVAALLVFAGCGSSNETSKENTTPPPAAKPAEPVAKQEPASVAGKVDTVNVVNVQTAPKPTYDQQNPAQQTATSPAMTSGFAVQIGAYKTEENAQRASSLAKDRFGLIVQTITDKTDGLFKVLVGSFASRDEARKFRDDITQKYPVDYKDAWVKDMSQN